MKKTTTKKHTLNPLPRNNQPTTTNIKELPLVTNPLTVVIDSKYEDKIMHLKSVPGLECFNVMLYIVGQRTVSPFYCHF